MPGKPVVTANKALLASPEGVALRMLAKEKGVDLLYEAAVAGAIRWCERSRVPHRRAHPPCHGHRQRDDQLHSDQDE